MNQLLTKQQSSQLQDFLETAYPRSTISIEDLAYKLHSNEETIEKVLIKLSDYQIIEPYFILRCDNEEFDNVHTFEFSSLKELINFVKDSDKTCNNCDSEFHDENVEVYFRTPSTTIKKVNSHD